MAVICLRLPVVVLGSVFGVRSQGTKEDPVTYL